MEQKVTSIEQLKAYANGQMVELPPFAEGQPFVVRMKRPSMMVLVKTGKVPNRLITMANQLFLGNKKMDEKNVKLLPEMFEVFDAIVDASLIEPKYSDIKNAGIELTDDQLMAIFNYTQSGVKALERFHNEPTVNVGSGNEQEVLKTAK